MASEKTISLRCGKGLIFAAAVGAAVILAAVINIGAFFESESFWLTMRLNS